MRIGRSRGSTSSEQEKSEKDPEQRKSGECTRKEQAFTSARRYRRSRLHQFLSNTAPCQPMQRYATRSNLSTFCGGRPKYLGRELNVLLTISHVTCICNTITAERISGHVSHIRFLTEHATLVELRTPSHRASSFQFLPHIARTSRVQQHISHQNPTSTNASSMSRPSWRAAVPALIILCPLYN